MSPAAIDREFRSLSEEAGGSERQLVSLFQALLQMLLSRQNYELGQAYLGLALKVEMSSISPYFHFYHFFNSLSSYFNFSSHLIIFSLAFIGCSYTREPLVEVLSWQVLQSSCWKHSSCHGNSYRLTSTWPDVCWHTLRVQQYSYVAM